MFKHQIFHSADTNSLFKFPGWKHVVVPALAAATIFAAPLPAIAETGTNPTAVPETQATEPAENQVAAYSDEHGALVASSESQYVIAEYYADATLIIRPNSGQSNNYDLPGSVDLSEMKRTTKVHFKGTLNGLSGVDFSEFTRLESVTADAGAYLPYCPRFQNCVSLTNISGLSKVDLKSPNYSHYSAGSFSGCEKLSDISPLKNWDTSEVTSMSGMFSGCKALKDISPLANWNTSKVTHFSSMFSGCSSITTLDALSKWDSSSVQSMSSMFSGCSSLTNINALAKWNTSQVTDLSYVFGYCSKLADVKPLANWDTYLVRSMNGMFNGCSSLRDITPLGNWDTTNVTDMVQMFYSCPIEKLTFGPKWKPQSDMFHWELDEARWGSADAKHKGALTGKQLIANWSSDKVGTWVRGTAMYRLYNPNSGEHFYTANENEKNSLVWYSGWKDEGVGWTAPVRSSIPVYRLYSGSDHHYTTSAAEKNALVKAGWKYEGIGWYSDEGKSVPLYRQFNPNVNPKASRGNSGSHNYTTSINEHRNLVRNGWKDEGVAWHGIG